MRSSSSIGHAIITCHAISCHYMKYFVVFILTYNASINVKPEGWGVGHRVGILTVSKKNCQNPHTRAKNNCRKLSKSPNQGKTVIYPSVHAAHEMKALNNVPKPQLNIYTEHFSNKWFTSFLKRSRSFERSILKVYS